MKSLAGALLLIALFPSYIQAQLTLQQRSAKDNGIVLYNQYKAISAIPFLTIAAEAGDHEAQYYLAEALRTKNHYVDPDVRSWYEASANQGDLYAMIELGRIERDICEISNDRLSKARVLSYHGSEVRLLKNGIDFRLKADTLSQ